MQSQGVQITDSFYPAVLSGNVALVEKLISHVDLEARYRHNNNCTALTLATIKFANLSGVNIGRNYRMVEALLKHGADVNAQDDRGKTALHHLMYEPDIKIVELLLKYKADLNIKDNYDETPLVKAVESGNLDVVKLLVNKGADVNPKLTRSLLFAKNLEIVKFFLNNGVNLDALDEYGRSLLMHQLYEDYIHSEEILIFLLKYSNVNLIDSKGKNILSYAYKRFETKLILKQIAILTSLDLPVNSNILKTISNKSEFENYFIDCKNELTLAQNTKLKNSWITFFNLLFDNKRKLKNYAGNKDIVSDIQNSECLNKFPIYGAAMQKKMEKGIKRRELFFKSTVLLSNCLPIFNPDHLIIKDILDCVLNIKNLSKLNGF